MKAKQNKKHHLRSYIKEKISKKLTNEIKNITINNSHCNKLLGKTEFPVIGLKLCLIRVKNQVVHYKIDYRYSSVKPFLAHKVRKTESGLGVVVYDSLL